MDFLPNLLSSHSAKTKNGKIFKNQKLGGPITNFFCFCIHFLLLFCTFLLKSNWTLFSLKMVINHANPSISIQYGDQSCLIFLSLLNFNMVINFHFLVLIYIIQRKPQNKKSRTLDETGEEREIENFP